MDDAISLTFGDDADNLGGVIYFDRKAFTEHTDSMDHAEEDEFNRHLNNLIEKHRYAELAQYRFLSFVKPADYDREKYSVEPLAREREEWNAANDQAMLDNAISRANRQFHLFWLCAHPEEVKKLQNEVSMTAEDFAGLHGIGDAERVEEVRGGPREHFGRLSA